MRWQKDAMKRRASKDSLPGKSKASAAAGKQAADRIAHKTGPYGDLSPNDGPAKILEQGLYLTATPIGHARDISLRALEVLKSVDLIAAEDTRVTAKLLAIHGIQNALAPYNDHNAAKARPALLAKLKEGGRVALVSDAGTPLVSDPGFKLVRAAIAEGIKVHAVPGASAALAGLTLSGLPSDRFLFAGFLPAKAGERRTALEELRTVPATLIFFESAQRLAESLAAMAEILGARDAMVGRELTKLHEELRRGSLAELAAHYAKAEAPKGEVTLVIGPPQEAEADFAKIEAALDAALPFMPLKPASEMIAALTGAPRKDIYARGLERKNAQKE
jgi:16S rRNA (cytidine1402-2'-O)-methyltransferase